MTDKTPLDELQWKSPEWIQAFGLRTDNVLEYFSESPFFDRTSNNQVVKMQSQFNEQIQLNSSNIENELKRMVGIEYIILHRREPDFWIIRKQKRLSPEKAEPISDYYIIGANVYMSPTVKDVISTRLLSTALSLGKALNKIQSLAQFTSSDGHTYKNITDPTIAAPINSRSRTISNTPATPTVNNNNSGVKSEGLSKATLDNLFNISLSGNPTYLDENPTESVVVEYAKAEEELKQQQSLKKGRKVVK